MTSKPTATRPQPTPDVFVGARELKKDKRGGMTFWRRGKPKKRKGA